jgi:hypothetical protein
VAAGCAYSGTNLPDPAKLGEGNVDSRGRHWGQDAPPQVWIPNRIHPWPVPVRVFPTSALAVPVPDDCEGTIAYVDPPYSGCTGYAHDLPRADVLDLARRWSDAGAVVVVSEAVPLDLPGWFHVRIDGERKGQKRTFSKQQAEYLTLNREPVWRPVAGQVPMWGAA